MSFNVASLFSIAILVLYLLCLLLVQLIATELGLPKAFTPGRLTLLVAVVISLLVLSGCGTAPLPARTSPPVPAGLLTPPRAPVLLHPASPLKTPGETTPSTPRPALKTGSTTSA